MHWFYNLRFTPYLGQLFRAAVSAARCLVVDDDEDDDDDDDDEIE